LCKRIIDINCLIYFKNNLNYLEVEKFKEFIKVFFKLIKIEDYLKKNNIKIINFIIILLKNLNLGGCIKDINNDFYIYIIKIF